MPLNNPNSSENFVKEFLKHYLKNGIGAMSKSDIDALVMYLLDNFSSRNNIALMEMSNQVVSETLRASVSKIKKLRYDAGLKYAARAEDEALKRFSLCLTKATINVAGDTINLIVEDQLAKNWIQGQLKERGYFFDGSFNSEIIKINPEEFFLVLKILIDDVVVDSFKAKYDILRVKKKGQDFVKGFSTLIKAFSKEIVITSAVSYTSSLIGLPIH